MSSSMAVVTTETLLKGFEQGHARVRCAARGLAWQPMYFAIFETLNWAASLDDRLHKPRSGNSLEDDHLNGLRYARNRTHHQWANALVFDTGATAVLGHMTLGRAQLGRAHPSITWRLADDLPPPSPDRDEKLKRAYARSLQTCEVSASLEVIAKALAAFV